MPCVSAVTICVQPGFMCTSENFQQENESSRAVEEAKGFWCLTPRPPYGLEISSSSTFSRHPMVTVKKAPTNAHPSSGLRASYLVAHARGAQGGAASTAGAAAGAANSAAYQQRLSWSELHSLAPLTLSDLRSIVGHPKVVLLRNYSYRRPVVEAGTVGVFQGIEGERARVDFPGRPGPANPTPQDIAFAPGEKAAAEKAAAEKNQQLRQEGAQPFLAFAAANPFLAQQQTCTFHVVMATCGQIHDHMKYKMLMTDKISKVMDAFCASRCVDRDKIEFHFAAPRVGKVSRFALAPTLLLFTHMRLSP